MYFLGTFEQKVDEKGRVNVPIKFRDILRSKGDERLLITNSRIEKVPCLDAYTYDGWMQRVERVNERADLDPKQRRFYLNFYFPGVQECPVDKQGRILIPNRLREFAGLDHDIVFTGVVDMFRIWEKQIREPVVAAAEQVALDDPEFVPGFGL